MVSATLVPSHLLPPRRYQRKERLRTLFFDLNAIADVEKLARAPIGEALQGGTFASLRLLVWSGLLHESSDLSERDVGTMMWRCATESATIPEYLDELNTLTIRALRNNELFRQVGENTGEDEDEEGEGSASKNAERGPSTST